MSDVVTGEAVALDLPVANFPSRLAALLLDVLVQIGLLLIIFTALGITSRTTSADYVSAEVLAAYVLVIVAYPTTFETLSRGKTLGKLALGLRVVGDDGSPVRFRQALVRAPVGAFEIWTIALAPVALISSLISARGKRVGDIFAGTHVIQERAPARQPLPAIFAAVPPPLAGWAQMLQVSRLSDQTADAASSYLRRFAELSPRAREALGIQLANAVAAEVSPLPPAGTPPAAYLSAVLAVRRAHEQVSPGQGVSSPYAPEPQAAPAQPRPAVTQPVTAEPVVNQPVATGPLPMEPVTTERSAAEPAPAQSPTPDPTERRLAPPA